MIMEIISATIPLATNIVKSISGAKEKKIEAEMALNENTLKIMQIKKEMFIAELEADKSRFDNIKSTFLSGVKWVDAIKTSIPTAFGLVAVVVIIKAVFGDNLYNLDMQSIINSVLLYFLSSFSAYKCFKG